MNEKNIPLCPSMWKPIPVDDPLIYCPICLIELAQETDTEYGCPKCGRKWDSIQNIKWVPLK